MSNNRTKIDFILALLVVSLIPLISARSQNIDIKPEQDWVKKIAPEYDSKVSSYDVNSGFYTSLIDNQINLSEEADFNHFKIKILTNGGVSNASQLYITYDTAYQKLQFHYLYVWRKGKKIDRTSEITFETVNNENELHANIYTGQITAHEILEDIRKNDEIEYAYTIIGENPIFNDERFRILTLENANPIDYFYTRILYPSSEEYIYDCSGFDKSLLKKSIEGQNTVLEIARKNVEAVELEETIPSWHIPFKYFVLTNSKNWEEVNNWALEVFELESEPVLDEVFEEIFTGNEDLDEKINACIDYVQNEIRYMGIESGIGSIKPFSPDQVVKQRFGDCKDKSLLLVSLLNKIGISNSYPALVNSILEHKVSDILPSNHMFDHCIVYFEHEGNKYWIDPSMPLQGGDYKSKSISDYGKALVIKQGNVGLTEMNVKDEFSKTEVKETLVIHSFTEAATLKVESKLYGVNADFFRNMLEYYSLKDLSESFKNVYSPLFPNIIEVDKLAIDDDVLNNILTLTEYYSIEDIWHIDENLSIKRRIFQFEPIGLYNYVTPTSCETKKFPVAVPYPSEYLQTTIISLPDKITINESEINFDNEAFTYKKTMEGQGKKTIKLTYSYKTKKKEVEPSEFKNICTEINNILRDIPLQIYYPLTYVYENRIDVSKNN